MALDYYYYSYEGQEEEEDYIDMEVTSYYSNLFSTTSPPHQPEEFEFHMSSRPLDTSLPTTSPADELFYNGKLLPLHHPLYDQPELYGTPLATDTTPTPLFQSCNVSPVESCHVSRELNPLEYFDPKKPSWTRKLKMIKKSASIAEKLKASRAYLRSFWKRKDEGSSKREATKKDTTSKDEKVCHRRKMTTTNLLLSSSSASSSGSSSSSSASSSSRNLNVQVLKRINGGSSELESSIEGAIAHCKQSARSSVKLSCNIEA